MSIQNPLNRYALAVRARGDSEETIKHTRRIVGYFDSFMGSIQDVASIEIYQ